jgi:hypothetical protein
MSATLDRTTANGTGLSAAMRWTAVATTAVVIIQAALAGQWLAGDVTIIALHGVLGNLAYIGALAMVVIGFLAWRRGAGAGAIGLPALLVLMMTGQLGFGYMGRKLAWAAGLHIPLGVLIVALLVWMIALASLRPANGVERA